MKYGILGVKPLTRFGNYVKLCMDIRLLTFYKFTFFIVVLSGEAAIKTKLSVFFLSCRLG